MTDLAHKDDLTSQEDFDEAVDPDSSNPRIFREKIRTPEKMEEHMKRIRESNRPHADVPLDLD